MTHDLILARAERLCLLGDIRRATRAHRATRALYARLRAVTARIAAMEAGCSA